jgi:glycosyltransferase involved in cell wall biosynthesis
MRHVAIVIPVWNEQEVLPELFARLQKLFAQNPTVHWSVIFVDDGSADGSGALISSAAQQEPRFKLIELSRNFGHQPALEAGLAAAVNADAVITMDADLQDPPEHIPELLARWQEGAEVVLAIRRSRKERGVRRLGFELFHRCFQRLSDFPIERNTGTFGLLDRAAVEAFNRLPERHRFFPGLRAWVGFRRAEIFYDRDDRAAGQPGQSLYRLARYGVDGLISFSKLPLRVVTFTGMVISLIGFGLALFFIVRRLMGIEVAQTGFTTLVTLILFVGGVQLVGIGILGEYLGRVYDEVKQRPNYVVRRTLGLD